MRLRLPDGKYGWSVGDIDGKGSILYTDDRGQTWKSQKDLKIISGVFLDYSIKWEPNRKRGIGTRDKATNRH